MCNTDLQTCNCEHDGGDVELSKGEHVAATLLSLAVRVWCLPVLLLVWLTLGLVIGVIRVASPLVSSMQAHGLFGSTHRRAHALD